MNDVTLTMTTELLDAIAERVAQMLQDAPATPAAPDFMTADEAAAHLRCDRRRIYDLTGARRLPKFREGGRLLLRRADVYALIEAA